MQKSKEFPRDAELTELIGKTLISFSKVTDEYGCTFLCFYCDSGDRYMMSNNHCGGEDFSFDRVLGNIGFFTRSPIISLERICENETNAVSYKFETLRGKNIIRWRRLATGNNCKSVKFQQTR